MKGTLKPFSSETLFSPPPPPRDCHAALSPDADFYSADATPFKERELLDVCSFVEDDQLVEIVRIGDTPKPFAAVGSYQHKHGDVHGSGALNGLGSRFSAEAPAKLEHGTLNTSSMNGKTMSPSLPIVIANHSEPKVHRKLSKQSSLSSDVSREEAWERKRELYVMDGRNQRMPSGASRVPGRTVARSVSDCGERTWPLEKPLEKVRTRSLTDEDLEELRGCIDLGFGFRPDEDCNLSGTLPALELYYAINRQYMESKSRSSPVSPLEGRTLYGASSDEGPGSPLSDSWRISSPGDTPSQVKTRLRHWAQAVACSVKQGVSL
ncbi:hypothetical protein L7F22_008583 [Adiantum nelumboides]|nr:hypothetical protein [Adiantum nelumboides]